MAFARFSSTRTGLSFPLSAISLACTLLFSACAKQAEAPKAATPPAIPVTVIEVQAQKLPTTIELMAQTEGAKETEVRARVGGILLKRFYEEGAPVKEGTPLFQIDPAPYTLALAEAKAKAAQTAREEKRLKGLLSRQAISQKEYDDAASANAMAQAAFKQAQLNLSWTKVTAPVSGVTGRALKSEGSLIGSADASAMTSIYQTNPMWVRFGLSESDTSKLPGRQLKAEMIGHVDLILPDGSVYDQPGKINFLASTVDTTLGTQQLRAEFDNKDGKLLPGQFVSVRLQIDERESVFLVPQAAVLQTEQARLVMLAGPDDKVSPRPVETAEWLGKNWVITKGLQAGDKVIVDNLMKLRPGATVAPHPPQAPQQPASAKP